MGFSTGREQSKNLETGFKPVSTVSTNLTFSETDGGIILY
jgi:hypothetical protein